MSILIDLMVELDNDSDCDPEEKYCHNCRFQNFEFCVLFEEPLIKDFDKSGMINSKRSELCIDASGCSFELEET